MDPQVLTSRLKQRAHELGFGLTGACPAVEPEGITRLDEWLKAGYAGEMEYLQARRAAYEHPRHVLDGVRSLLMLGMHYRTVDPKTPAAGEGRISRYAWAADYHLLIRDRLNELAEWLTKTAAGSKARGVVDTAPLLEREFAQFAGLGWIGKNTMLLNRDAGSWFFLAALLTDVELAYDAPAVTDHCGTCTACLDACPTNAFPKPGVLDSRKCISYLTIELKSSIPHDLRPELGDWLFGCDICQEVCPWNGRAPISQESVFEPVDGLSAVELTNLFDMSDDAFRNRYRESPLWRPRRRGILRNAAIVLGNRPSADALSALTKGLSDTEPLVRGACAWALGHYDFEEAKEALRQQLEREKDADVRGEIRAALA